LTNLLKTNFRVYKNYFIPFAFLLIASGLFPSCKKKGHLSSFYYSGNDSVEIIIPGDTLGFLFKDPPPGVSKNIDTAFNQFKASSDSILALQGFKSAGYTTNNVELLISRKKKLSLAGLEEQAVQLKKSNPGFIVQAGYLARIKSSNEPVIITDQINIAFKNGTTTAQINSLFNQYHLAVIYKNPFNPLEFTVAVTDSSESHALKMSHNLKQNPVIRYAYIDIIYRKVFDSVIPSDIYFNNQWHLFNTGINSDATEDADIDAEQAWDYTTGSPGITIAVIDAGFDVLHEDLIDNFSKNVLDIPRNNTDDDDYDNDPRTFIDDTIGWNFTSNSNNLSGDRHGTAVAGIAASNLNGKGTVGSCPKCGILPLRTLVSAVESEDIRAIEYAVYRRNARIINLSWHPTVDLPTLKQKVLDLVNTGIIIICSMSNEEEESCQSFSLTNIRGTISVSRSNRWDNYDNSGKGDCLDLLAPSSKRRTSDEEIYGIATTDVTGNDGYTDGVTEWNYPAVFPGEKSYFATFMGTSAAVPLTAGVAGLILSVDPSVTGQQVQQLLKDCADKIEPSRAAYSTRNGKSTANTHGYGRLNAWEAVRIAAPLNNGSNKPGLGGMDAFFRDNELDWGNTEQPSSTKFESPREFISYWKSEDIKVDAPPFVVDAGGQPVLINNNKKFEDLDDENIEGGSRNRVYVRIRNRGYKTIPSAIVKLHWTNACLGFPSLPADFWDRFPADASDVSVWHPFPAQQLSNLRYSGSSVAGSMDDDGSQIVMFEFDAPVHDIALPKNHYCLMALVSCSNDPIPTAELRTNPNRLNMDFVTKNFNNATHRNYIIVNPADPLRPLLQQFYIYNPYPYSFITKIKMEHSKNIKIAYEDSAIGNEFALRKGEFKKVTIKILPGQFIKPEEIIIKQILVGKPKNKEEVMGGLSFKVNTPKNR